MPKISCLVCDTWFYAKPSHVAKGWGKYCSKTCQYAAARKGKIASCHTCSTEIYRTAKDQRSSKSGYYFCSKRCQTIWRNSQIFIAEKHGNWTDGGASYRQRLIRSERQQICAKCNTDDVRILAVHHKDRDHNNNALRNLIWLCHNCHYLVHHIESEAQGFLTA